MGFSFVAVNSDHIAIFSQDSDVTKDYFFHTASNQIVIYFKHLVLCNSAVNMVWQEHKRFQENNMVLTFSKDN